MHLHRHLIDDPRYDHDMAIMAGAVRFAAECEREEQQIFWSKLTLGDLEVLIGTPDTIKSTYREAIAKNDKDWFAFNSSIAQLQLPKDLSFRPDHVAVAIATFDRALQTLRRPKDHWQPRQVFFFSGHRIDEPDRQTKRFPAEKKEVAGKKIAEALDQFGAGPENLAMVQGPSGGNLVFLEACRQRNVHLQLLLPLPEPEFIDCSIPLSANGDQCRERFYRLKTGLEGSPRIMPDELGPLPKGANPFERCNLWLLYTALSYGINQVRFLCLWDGGDDEPGGTAHMYEEVKRRTGQVTWINTTIL